MKKETQQKIEQLQYLQQNLAQFHVQRQTFQSQLLEVESAAKELKGSKQAYKIVGNIMIDVDKNALSNELDEKKETLKLRISTLERQEAKMKEKAESMQKDVMSEMES